MNQEMDFVEGYSVVETGDGSPSLRGEREPMHHLGGAYTETQYIYGDALRKLIPQAQLEEWRVIVVGLGLGYIELLSMAEALKNQKKLHLLSYEINSQLVQTFLNWLSGEQTSFVYDQLYSYFERDYKGVGSIKLELYKLYQNGDWIIKGGLDESSLAENKIPVILENESNAKKSNVKNSSSIRTEAITSESIASGIMGTGAMDDKDVKMKDYNAILFDAFSGKSTPELWTEDFLRRILSYFSAPFCVFSTYACTGVLKRILADSQFAVEKRPGFQGKRHSTMAIRI